MLRYLIPAVVMVGGLVVLLAGAVGNFKSLPELESELPDSVARAIPGGAQAPIQAAPTSAAVPPAAADQAAIDTLRQQVSQLQQLADQRRKQLAALSGDEDAEQHKLASLQQQRQAEEAAVAQLQAQQKQLAIPSQPTGGAGPAQPPAAPAEQEASKALEKQSAELQSQIKQQSDELATLRVNEEQERHALDALHQKRQTEEAAMTHLQSQREQLASAAPSAPSAPSSPSSPSSPPALPQAKQPTAEPGHAAMATDSMQAVVADLRAKQHANPSPPSAPVRNASAPQPYTPTQPMLIVSTKGVLVTARELLASGRTSEARQLLMKAQAQSTLHPVTPDQPYATGSSMTATQIGDAIHFLDSGNTGQAMQAINLAMDNVSSGPSTWPAYPQSPPNGGYAPGASYYGSAGNR